MAFSSFASFSPLINATLNIPQSNDSNPMNMPINDSLLKKQSIVHRDYALFSSPLKSYDYKYQSSLLTDDFGLEAPAKMKILKHALTEIGDPRECLNLIDATQRLGIDYHFQEEIEAVFQREYVVFTTDQFDKETDLHKTALFFRLFRQQGYLVSTDVFKIFLDDQEKFDEKLIHDISGLTSLYEASQLCMHGEDILEEAENFSYHWLNVSAAHVDHHLATFMRNTLAHPHHKSVVQFMVPNYLGDTQWVNKWINILQDVAKMEFNTTQRLHQNEIFQFTKWWKETNLARELNFARDQPIKWYLGSLVCLTDSCYSEERVQLAKSISFIYLIDDLFDIYGSLDQLTLFTEAIFRWDLAATERLPDCMRSCLKSLFEVTNEISNKIYQKQGWNPIGSLSKAWAKLCKAFLVEAEWLSCGHSPSAEEYLRNGVVSTGVHVILVHVFFLLGEQIKKQTVELLDEDLDIASYSAMILRLWDDMGTAKDEMQDGRDGSYLEYYMKEHPSICHEGAQQHSMKKILEAWKSLNTEHLLSKSNSSLPAKFTQASLNVARAVPLAYNYGRNQSIMTLEKLIEQLLFRPIQM